MGIDPILGEDTSGAAMMINARSESAATKPAFRDALKSRRCLVPADAFYEWQKIGKAKQPFCFEVRNGELFHSRGCGIAGEIRAANESRPARYRHPV